MAKAKYYLDTRAPKKDGTCPLKICVSAGQKRVMVMTGVYLRPSEWAQDKVVSHPQKEMLNVFLTQKKLAIDMELLRVEGSVRWAQMNAARMKQWVQDILFPEKKEQREQMERERQQGAFMRALCAFRDKHQRPNTWAIYDSTIKALHRYCEGVDALGFDDITKDWLERFDAFLSRTSKSRNARNIHLRNIRAAFNDAIDNEQTTCYPFRRLKLRYDPTRKRSLAVEELRRLWNYPVEEWQQRYLDCFKLIFLLIGINISDLCELRPNDLRNGRIEYRRNKTGKIYSVKVEKEAMEIIEKYRGKDWLLNYLDTYRCAADWMRKVNRALQSIGSAEWGKQGRVTRHPEWPELTTYWARHTWATIASSIDVPIDVIAHALGHSNGGYRITSIYIDFDMSKVDKANRRVIDWVMEGKGG